MRSECHTQSRNQGRTAGHHTGQKKSGIVWKFLVLGIALIALILVSMVLGSIRIGFVQLIRGLFSGGDEAVAAVVDLRFPRILISLLAGAALAVSGCLLQSVLHNPLADPGIIGVSGGAQFASSVLIMFLPQLYFFMPLFAFIGGALAFLLVYLLAIRGGMKALRILLIGVAINAMFLGLVESFQYLSGQILGSRSGTGIVNLGMKGWPDVHLLLYYVPIGLVLAFLMARLCNIMLLDEKTVAGLGLRVRRIRFGVSMLAVLLASMVTAVVGVISFLALIVPHVVRGLVGHDHRRLLPFAALFGAFVFLLCDTLGRCIAPPIEIPAAILMTVFGGPIFVVMLRRGGAVRHDG